jgi:hypothetical protein
VSKALYNYTPLVDAGVVSGIAPPSPCEPHASNPTEVVSNLFANPIGDEHRDVVDPAIVISVLR